MAPIQDNQRRVSEKKASAFEAPAYRREDVAGESKGGKNHRAERKMDRGDTGNGRKRFGWRVLLVDLVVLAILAALIVGCVFGYRALKNVYTPQWDEKTVEFCIRIPGVSVEDIYDEAGTSLFEGCDVWDSHLANGERLGTVTDVTAPPEENGKTATLYVTVRGTALYRGGEGYYVGKTRLLAGTDGVFRVGGMVAEGDMISLRECE